MRIDQLETLRVDLLAQLREAVERELAKILTFNTSDCGCINCRQINGLALTGEFLQQVANRSLWPTVEINSGGLDSVINVLTNFKPSFPNSQLSDSGSNNYKCESQLTWERICANLRSVGTIATQKIDLLKYSTIVDEEGLLVGFTMAGQSTLIWPHEHNVEDSDWWQSEL